MVLTAMSIHMEISRVAEWAPFAGDGAGRRCIAPSIYGVSAAC